MKLFPSEPIINDMDGFTPQNDIFGLSDFGNKLMNLIQNLEDNPTIILDGQWGSGKTTFIKQWAGLLRNNDIPVIHFDAFENDFQEDAFLALAGEIQNYATKNLEKNKTKIKKFTETSAKIGKAFLPLAVKASIRVATLGAANSDDIQNLLNNAGDITESIILEKLQSVSENKDLFKDFKNQLEIISSAHEQGKGDEENEIKIKPLVIIIDELDRCNPKFALGILEKIKHFFAVKNVCFVLVSNLNQLEAIVRGSYGEGTKAALYLEKFYDLKIELPKIKKYNSNKQEKYIEHLWKSMSLNSDDHNYDEGLKEEFSSLANEYNLSLRTIEKITSHFALVIASTNRNTLRITCLISGLCFMKHLEPNLFFKAKSGTLKWEEVNKFLLLENGRRGEWAVNWWKYTTLKELPEEKWVEGMGQGLWKYSVDREQVLRLLTKFIDEFNFK
jgi:energy-coupling factor transporter ATP-binding protein EcfA2